VNSTPESPGFRQRISKEIALFSGFVFVGLVILPSLIFAVGESVFGTYGGVGYFDFFATLSGKVRGGDHVAWFLISSPYLGWQCLRLMAYAWRISGR